MLKQSQRDSSLLRNFFREPILPIFLPDNFIFRLESTCLSREGNVLETVSQKRKMSVRYTKKGGPHLDPVGNKDSCDSRSERKKTSRESNVAGVA